MNRHTVNPVFHLHSPQHLAKEGEGCWSLKGKDTHAWISQRLPGLDHNKSSSELENGPIWIRASWSFSNTIDSNPKSEFIGLSVSDFRISLLWTFGAALRLHIIMQFILLSHDIQQTTSGFIACGMNIFFLNSWVWLYCSMHWRYTLKSLWKQ